MDGNRYSYDMELYENRCSVGDGEEVLFMYSVCTVYIATALSTIAPTLLRLNGCTPVLDIGVDL